VQRLADRDADAEEDRGDDERGQTPEQAPAGHGS
jgi:hypothetical protein